LLLEAFGRPERAPEAPMELLRFWRQARHPDLPSVPGPVRRLLADPEAAGMPRRTERPGELRLMRIHRLERQLATGDAVGLPPEDLDIPLSLRLTAAARGRAMGSPYVCEWLQGASLPAGVRTGCPDEVPDGGVVYVRARRLGGTEVVSRAAGGGEAVLVVWPRWALFPVVAEGRDALLLIDELGVWEIALAGRRQPRLLAEGSFRHLAVNPSGSRVATVEWPNGNIIVVEDELTRRFEVTARAGLVWLEQDVLLAADPAALKLVSAAGEHQPFPLELECVRFLTGRGESVLVSTGLPCAETLQRFSLVDPSRRTTLAVPGGSGGAAILPDGTVLFSAGEGLSRWRGGEQVERLAAGLTPGPG